VAELDQQGLQIDPGVRRIAKSRLPLLEGQQIAEELFRGGFLGFLGETSNLLGVHKQQVLGFFQGRGQEQVAEMFDQVLEKHTEVMPSLDQRVDKSEDGLRFFFQDRRRTGIKQLRADRAQDLLEIIVIDDLSAEGDGLVEKALGVPETPFSGVGDQGEGGRANRYAVALGDIHQVIDDLLLRDLLEFKVLTAGDDGRGHLIELRGGEDEHRILGRLFQCLEEGVESRSGDLVDFVDDDDFIAAADGLVFQALAQGPNVIDSSIRGPVDLQNVDRAVFLDLQA